VKWLPLLLLWPALAWADPISITAALSSAWAAISAITVVQAIGIISFVSSVYGSAQQRRKARKAAARQRAEYNASLEDRSLTLLQANPPVRVVYGRCIVGGDIVAMFTSDKTGVRENGSTYTKADAYKHLVIVVAAHEVQAINDVLIDGVSIGPLDGSGWVTSGEFYTASKPAIRTVDVPAGSYVDVSPAVVSVVNSWSTFGSGIDAAYTSASVSLSMGNTRISNATGNVVTVSYTVNTSVAALRVSKFLGTSGQAVDTYLNSVAPSQWTSNHRLRGLAGIVVTLDLEEPRFQAGPPQITVDVSGKKVYDTRTSTTVYTENPALIVRDFLTSSYGLGVNASEIDVTACNTAANACEARLSATVQAYAATCTANTSGDYMLFASERWFSTGDGVRFTTTGTLPAPLSAGTTYYVIYDTSRVAFRLATSVANAFAQIPIDITSAGTGTHTGTWYDYAAYTCNGAFATDGSGKEAVLEDLVETMAGTATYGATWIIQAGAWVSSVMSLGDDDLDGQIEIVQAGAGLDAIINGVRGQFIPAGKTTPVDMTPYQNATFLAADGQALWEDVSLPYVNNKVRAANLARIRVEQARDGLMVRFPAKLKAWPLQIGDRVAVTSTEYGWSAKTFRVTDWQFGDTTAVILTLQEDAAAVYDLADAVTADPAPNTGLPSPWTVASLTGVSASSSYATIQKSGRSPLVPRVLVQWNAITDPYVAGAGGAVEIAWRRPGGVWQQTSVPGDSTQAYLDGVDDGDLLTISARARNSLGAVSQMVYLSHVVDGKASMGRMFRAITLGYSAHLSGTSYPGYPSPIAGVYDAVTNTGQQGVSYPYTVGKINRSTGAYTAVGSYDTLNGVSHGTVAASCAAMASALNAIGSDYIVVVFTWDEPQSNRLSNGLEAAMYRCGASRAVFGSSSFAYRSAYILIGVGGCGEGQGFEAYAGAGGSDVNAWVDVAVQVVNGQAMCSGGGRVLTVGTSQLEPGAATETYLDYDAINNIFGTTGTCTFIRSFTVTPPVDCVIEATAVAVVKWLDIVTYNSYGLWTVTPSGGSETQLLKLAGGAYGEFQPHTGVALLSATGGVALTFKLYSCKMVTSASPQWRESTLRLAMVKR